MSSGSLLTLISTSGIDFAVVEFASFLLRSQLANGAITPSSILLWWVRQLLETFPSDDHLISSTSLNSMPLQSLLE